MGPVYPEAPKFKEPKQELRTLGVAEKDIDVPKVKEPSAKRCPECFAKLPLGAERCTFCNSQI